MKNIIKKLDDTAPLSNDPLPKRNGLVWLIVGQKGSSKTTMMLNVLNSKDAYRGFYDNIFIISPSMSKDEKASHLVEEVERDGNYYEVLNNNTVEAIMHKLGALNDQTASQGHQKKNIHNLLILDDCISMLPRSSQKQALFNQLIISCRHLKLSVWITLQKLKGASPLIRTNTDMLSMFRTDNASEKKDLIQDFGIPLNIYEEAINEPYSFLHTTFTSGRPLYFKRFEPISS